MALAKFDEDVEQLLNSKRNKANSGLKMDGQIADVFSPITNSPISVLKTIRDKSREAGAHYRAELTGFCDHHLAAGRSSSC